MCEEAPDSMYHSVFGGGVSVIMLKLWARSLWSQTASGGACRRPGGGAACGGVHSGGAGMPGSGAPKPNGAPAGVGRRPGRPGNIPPGLAKAGPTGPPRKACWGGGGPCWNGGVGLWCNCCWKPGERELGSGPRGAPSHIWISPVHGL
jgi:hypothetical protein